MPDSGAAAREKQMDDLLIWDAEGPHTSGNGTTVLWRGFVTVQSPNIVSIPQFIEDNADELRARYLAWVYELGESRIKGCRLVDHLQLRPGFSYWWMTLLVEKCNYSKSPLVTDAIRVLAFSEWAVGRSIARITLSSAKQPLAECLRVWCEKSGIQFEWRRLRDPTERLSWARRVYMAMPFAIQAWIWLAEYLRARWSLRGVGLQAWRQTQGRTTFVTYSANCVPEATQQGHYQSRYWGCLPDVMSQAARPTNWLHLYVKDRLLPTAKDAATTLDAFNRSAQGQQCHVALDTFIGLGVILRTIRDYLYLIRKGVQFRCSLNAIPDSALDLWPLLRSDWQMSIFGAVAMNNLVYLNLFESALRVLPKQKQGVYLQENMGWEFGFMNSWRAAGHGRLIGVPHSTVRFWDLRYFFDPRSYLHTGHNDLPLPDRVACNGPVMLAALQQGGYPAENLLDLEALRYLHTGHRQAVSDLVPNKTSKPLRLLVLGDYLPINTRLQMKLLEQAISLIPQPLEIIVKPHPNCPIQPKDYPALDMRVSMEPIDKFLAECDVAFASAVTSAAVDAYCTGVPVVSVLDPNILNLSPLRGCVGARFVTSAESLASVLLSLVNNTQASINQPAYFTIDVQLPNWRKLIL